MNIVLDLLLLLATIVYSYLESLVKFFIPRRRKSAMGEIVLITGARHGIGRLTAYEFAKQKSRLVLWDIKKIDSNEETHGLQKCLLRGLEAGEMDRLVKYKGSREAVPEKSLQIASYSLTITKKPNPLPSNQKIKKEVGDVTTMVNNTGTVYPADLLSTKDEEITKTFEVNVLGHFSIIKALLSSMMNRNHGHIVTVVSVCSHGLIPYLIPYCSSKFAAAGFYRALTTELKTLGKTGVKTSCLCPVFVNTGFTK
uniref:Hydroxysteroid 17-beta dehydrogenase 13 n=1 Tax=Loxodonta africana TaxID=9785 RepID=G3SV38_LOXAF